MHAGVLSSVVTEYIFWIYFSSSPEILPQIYGKVTLAINHPLKDLKKMSDRVSIPRQSWKLHSIWNVLHISMHAHKNAKVLATRPLIDMLNCSLFSTPFLERSSFSLELMYTFSLCLKYPFLWQCNNGKCYCINQEILANYSIFFPSASLENLYPGTYNNLL